MSNRNLAISSWEICRRMPGPWVFEAYQFAIGESKDEAAKFADAKWLKIS